MWGGCALTTGRLFKDPPGHILRHKNTCLFTHLNDFSFKSNYLHVIIHTPAFDLTEKPRMFYVDII